MNAGRGLRQIISGLLITSVVFATILGSAALSAQDGNTIALALISPTPTVPLVPTITLTPTPLAPGETPASPTPSQTPSPTPTICPIPFGWQPYFVTTFDTLDTLATKFKTTKTELSTGNCLTLDYVSFGQKIYTPALFELTPTPTPTACPYPATWVVSIVQPGETLSLIAARYPGYSMLDLMRANCLASPDVQPYQTLRVPYSYQPFPTPRPFPTWTPFPFPTWTPNVPTETPIVPTETPIVPPTETPIVPTETPIVPPTETPIVPPTETPAPPPTETPAPPPTETPITSPLRTPGA